MRTFEDLRAEILQLLDELGDIVQTRTAEEARHRLSAARERLEGTRLVAVVCGEFKRGKSSLLNALLEEPDLFPVDSFYATNVIITASYAAEERITVVVAEDNGSLRHLPIKRGEIASYATESGNPDNAQQAKLITIETPNSRLASGLKLVDTPGVGGVYEEHSGVTLGFLPQADAIIFVTDTTQPLAESELAFVRRAADAARITDDADAQLFVLTKTDLIGDFQAVLSNTKTKLAATTGRPAESLIVTPVSARAKLAYLKSGDDEYLEFSNFAELERVIWAALNRRRPKAILSGALGDLETATRSLLRPLEAESWKQERTVEETAALATQTSERSARLAELRDSHAAWRDELRAELLQVCQNLHERAQDELNQLWHRCEAVYLYRDDYLANPSRLVNQLAADAASIMGSVNELTSREAARVLRDFSALHGLTLQHTEIGRLPDPPVPAANVPADLSAGGPAMSKLSALDATARGTGASSPIGRAVGAAIGAIIGTCLLPGPGTIAGLQYGSLIGAALGSMFVELSAYRSAVTEVKEKNAEARRQRLWDQLDPQRKDQERHFDDAIDKLIDAYTDGVIAELESRILQEQQSVADTLRRLSAARATTERQAEERRAELAMQRQPLDRIRDRIDQLAVAVSRLGTAASETTERDRIHPRGGIGDQGSDRNQGADEAR